MFSLIAVLNACRTRFLILPGDDVTSVPIAAPRMTMNSEGWRITPKCPPAIAKPPATAASTNKTPGIAMTTTDSAVSVLVREVVASRPAAARVGGRPTAQDHEACGWHRG